MTKKREFKPEYNAILAFALSVLVLVVFTHFYKPPPPKPAATSQAQTKPQASTLPAPPAVPAESPEKTSTKPLGATQEKTLIIQSPLYRVELSNKGGVARSWKLLKYTYESKPSRPLDVIQTAGSEKVGAWPLSLLLPEATQEEKANSALYQMTPQGPSATEPTEVHFDWSDGHLAVQKTLKFGPGYVMDMDISVTNDGKPMPVGVAWRGGFGDPEVYKASQLVTVFYDISGKLTLLPYKKLGQKDHPAQPAQQPGTMSFAGIEDQFFAAAFLADPSGLSLWHWTEEQEVKEGSSTSEEPIAEMAAGTAAPGPLHLRLYVGPKELKVLGQQHPSLVDLVNFGFMSFIAKPLLEILRWIHGYIPNYGWAIIVLTLVINTALYPLKVKSWRSMQRMQKAKPLIDQIQARYKKYARNDPRKRKMNEEMMELYKREGINPVGGCGPMLLQLPVWWALWRTLEGAIELRHAPWILWVHDLSAYDHYYILPTLMVVTMYLTSKMTPTAVGVDPMQQKMMSLMPIVFGLLFFHTASGLVLYILTSNVVALAQQYFLNRTEPLPARGGNAAQK